MNLRWTKNALLDLTHAHAWIEAENSYAARAVIDRMEQSLLMLAAYPAAGRQGRCKDTRELIVVGTPFIIACRVRKNAIEILAVIHHARIWPEEI